MISLVQSDFTGIGQVAKHCDLPKLDIAINEAIEFDLRPLLCGLFYEVDVNWDEVNGIWADIISRKTFADCAGKQTYHLGIKKVLTYYAYARYVFLNTFDDTPNGQVTKTNNFSLPKPLNEIKAYSNKYKEMGRQAWLLVEQYIYLNSESYPNYEFSKTVSCECNGVCSSRANTKGFGIKSRNVTKWD